MGQDGEEEEEEEEEGGEAEGVLGMTAGFKMPIPGSLLGEKERFADS